MRITVVQGLGVPHLDIGQGTEVGSVQAHLVDPPEEDQHEAHRYKTQYPIKMTHSAEKKPSNLGLISIAAKR